MAKWWPAVHPKWWMVGKPPVVAPGLPAGGISTVAGPLVAKHAIEHAL